MSFRHDPASTELTKSISAARTSAPASRHRTKSFKCVTADDSPAGIVCWQCSAVCRLDKASAALIDYAKMNHSNMDHSMHHSGGHHDHMNHSHMHHNGMSSRHQHQADSHHAMMVGDLHFVIFHFTTIISSSSSQTLDAMTVNCF